MKLSRKFTYSGIGALLAVFFIHSAFASNIDPIQKWAWSDVRGWIDFYNSSVTVTASKLTGSAVFADTPNDFISLDCETSPNGNICATSNYFVSNDNLGNLAGWAWNDNIGWISFCGGQNTGVCPGSIGYQVRINYSTGYFSGFAWNDLIGWISFNCDQSAVGAGNTCGTVDYKVKANSLITSASGSLISNTFDTCPPSPPAGHPCLSGAAFNFISWKGSQGQAGNVVKFQLATSNCTNGGATSEECASGDHWDAVFVGPGGTGVSTDYYVPDNSGSGIPQQINTLYHNNKRYFRYKMVLERNGTNTASPVVTDVIISWAP